MAVRKEAHDPFDESITIERREVIDTIRLDPYGTVNPITAAMHSIGEWLPENIQSQSLSVEFAYGGRTFHVSVDAETPAK